MRCFFAAAACAIVLVANASVADEILFESATLGPTGITNQQRIDEQIPGTNVNEFVFVGARFELTQPVVTSRIGGHFTVNDATGGTFFGAVVALEGPDDFPDSGDLSTPDVLGDTLLSFPDPSAEVFGDLGLALEPGWYGIVFGSGLFGSSGSGGALRNGSDFQSTIYLGGFDGGWGNGLAGTGNSFSIVGRVVPEPSSLIVFLNVFTLALLPAVRGWPRQS